MLRARLSDVIGALAAPLLLLLLALLSSPAQAANVHRVRVGATGLAFDPSTVLAPAGDSVQFIFYPTVRCT